MLKLNLDYWTEKFDRLSDADCQVIEDAFHSSAVTNTGFDDEEKQLLADVLVAGVKVCATADEFEKAYKVCSRFNRNFAVDPLFMSPGDLEIRMWRYDYRKIANAIPDRYFAKAIRNNYARIGLDLSDDDVKIIGAQSHLYTMFLKFLKTEAGADNVIKPNPELHNSDRFVSYLNMYLLFDKLGAEGVDFFKFIASTGVTMPSYSTIQFIPKTSDIKGMAEEAAARSRGRLYPTFYELATVLCIGEDLK